MPVIKVGAHTLEVDIVSELERYEWTRAEWSADKLIAASPFRYEIRPSWFVNLTGEYAGTWADSGAYEPEWASGNFVKLLAFLRRETYEEAEDYLIETYGTFDGSKRAKIVMPSIHNRSRPKYLSESIIEQAISPYLLRRGLGEDTQRIYGIGHGKQKGFTAIPWRTASGRLANVMYRSTRGKLFFYEKGEIKRGHIVYGIDVVRKKQATTAALCEAPIDAMSWYESTAGEIVGIAVGGITISSEQAEIIKRSTIQTIILAGDNDKAGAKLNAEVKEKLRGHVRFKVANYGDSKDANEALQKKNEAPREGLR